MKLIALISFCGVSVFLYFGINKDPSLNLIENLPLSFYIKSFLLLINIDNFKLNNNKKHVKYIKHEQYIMLNRHN